MKRERNTSDHSLMAEGRKGLGDWDRDEGARKMGMGLPSSLRGKWIADHLKGNMSE